MCYSGLETIGYFVNEIFIPLLETGVTIITIGFLIYFLFYTFNEMF